MRKQAIKHFLALLGKHSLGFLFASHLVQCSNLHFTSGAKEVRDVHKTFKYTLTVNNHKLKPHVDCMTVVACPTIAGKSQAALSLPRKIYLEFGTISPNGTQLSLSSL